MKMALSLVNMVHYNEGNKHNYFSNKCNSKSLALNPEELMYELLSMMETIIF